MRYIRLILIIIILIILNSCDSTTKPKDTEYSLITDYINFSYDCDYLDTLRILDIDFTYRYHIEGSGGQLTRYLYYQRDINTEFGIGSGWSMKNNTLPPRFGNTRHYTEEDIYDTLRYSRLFDISRQDTFYREFKFTLKGFYSDSGFFNLNDTLDLETFEYVYIDTMLIIK